MCDHTVDIVVPAFERSSFSLQSENTSCPASYACSSADFTSCGHTLAVQPRDPIVFCTCMQPPSIMLTGPGSLILMTLAGRSLR
jgi:hypothetical protein